MMERIDKLKGMLATNPGDSFLQHALALEYIKQGDDAEARKLFEHLLQTNPGYVGSYYHLGKLLERIGDINTALKIYENGMKEAQKAGEQQAYGEMRGAWEELSF